MKVELTVKKEFDIKFLQVKAKARYWEDSEINGVDDSENGDNVPCKVGNLWCPKIDIESGVIVNWTQGVTADIHYKVCDCCGWDIIDQEGNIILSEDGDYVPSTLYPEGNGYGDYIIMKIDENGQIAKWRFDIDSFIKED